MRILEPNAPEITISCDLVHAIPLAQTLIREGVPFEFLPEGFADKPTFTINPKDANAERVEELISQAMDLL